MLEYQTWKQLKILVSSRTGPGTTRKLELILEPDPSNDIRLS